MSENLTDSDLESSEFQQFQCVVETCIVPFLLMV